MARRRTIRIIHSFALVTFAFPVLPFLVFLEKRQGKSPKNKDLYRYRTPKIPGKEGENAQKNKVFFFFSPCQGIPKKQGKEGQGCLKNEKAAQRVSFGVGYPADHAGIPADVQGRKLRSSPRNPGTKKTSILVRTSMARRRGRQWPHGGSKKYRSGKLRAEFSFPITWVHRACSDTAANANSDATWKFASES